MDPGETAGAGTVHEFYSCCGALFRDAPGCCYSPHSAFGEPEDTMMRRPGMGIPTEGDVIGEIVKMNRSDGSCS